MALSLAKSGVKLCITASKNGDAFKNTKEELIAILGEENVCAEVVDVSDAIGMSQLTESALKNFLKLMFLLIMRLEECGLYQKRLIRYRQILGNYSEAWSSIIDANVKDHS